MGSKLKEIMFLNNQLTGCIRERVGIFTEIQVLDVSYNTLMGHVPNTLSCLQDIQVLNLAHNKLFSELSDEGLIWVKIGNSPAQQLRALQRGKPSPRQHSNDDSSLEIYVGITLSTRSFI
ncbi:hypothetical protein Ahy_B08g090282 [Arachis hypogaea]|uniref:Uncharacterized protein n=1 Tax=Arachis hypogaea TaxID=3818 RepID=A0A444XZX4_ARAHY|nr:hypothetical protein Ahy_B08g090282 [Arachis hypogaea]